MSYDAREIALRLYGLANEGRWDEWILGFAEDGVLEEALLLDHTIYVGHAGLQEWLTVSSGAFVRPFFDVQDVEELGGGRFLVRYVLTASGATSDVPITQRVWHAVRVRDDGKVGYVGAFADEASARSELSASDSEAPSSTA